MARSQTAAAGGVTDSVPAPVTVPTTVWVCDVLPKIGSVEVNRTSAVAPAPGKLVPVTFSAAGAVASRRSGAPIVATTGAR